jgi:hypothetical protein
MPATTRTSHVASACAALLLALGAPATALADSAAAPAPQTTGCPPYDVILDVPTLSVDELTLEVDKLDAKLNLDARVSELVVLTAGVDLSIDKVALGIKGVQAEAHLSVCLDDVRAIIERTLDTLDRNPNLLSGLLSAVTGLLSQTVNALGQTLVRVVDSTGQILERTLDASGTVLSQTVVGNVLQLPTISTTTNAAGQTVRRVADQSGAIIEVVLDAAGKVLSTRVVSQGTATTAATPTTPPR